MKLYEKLKNTPSWIKESKIWKNRKDYIFYEDDFKNILKTIKFWKIKAPYPYEVWEFLLKNEDDAISFLKQQSERKINKHFVSILKLKKVHKLFEFSIKNNEFFLLKFLVDNYKLEDGYKSEIFRQAAEGSNLETVIYLYENDFYENNYFTCASAVRNEKFGLEILKFLRELSIPCQWHGYTCSEAAKNENQGLQILKWMKMQDPPCPWDEWACANAARNETNGLEILKWLRSQNPPCPWDENTCDYAVGNEADGFEILKWLRAQEPPCPWDDRICLPPHYEYKTHAIKVLEWLKTQKTLPCSIGQINDLICDFKQRIRDE